VNKSNFNKRVVGMLRFVYRVGIVKSLLILAAMAAGGEEMEVKWKGRGVNLRKGTSDLHVFRQVLAFEQYKTKQLKPEKVKTIVDLGANIGLSVLYLRSQYPGARIIAVEPDKDNFDLLVKNVAGLPDVYCVNKAIWHSSRTLGLFDTGGGAYSYLVKEESIDEKAAIRSVSINELLDEYKFSSIDLLKIDIEGSEKELFAVNYKEWLPKVGCVVIELHDWFRPGCAASFFRAVCSREYNLSFKGENVTVLFTDTIPGDTLPDLLISKKGLEDNKAEQLVSVSGLLADDKNRSFANTL
jgi:FkbM family methyltransferase